MPQRLVGSALVVTMALCACAGKDSGKQDSSKPVSQTGSVAATSMASFNPATHVAVLHAKDFAFDAPDSITAGWTTFHFVNDGPNIHHAQLVRLDSGKTVADLQKVFQAPGEPPRWMVLVGGSNAPDPGSQTDGEFNLEAGNYAIVCFVDLPDHVPHAAKGMVHALTVTAATGAPTAAPASDIAVVLSDYSFTVKGAFTAGKHTIKVTNNGPQPHELELMRLLPGKTIKDVGPFFNKPSGPPPVSALGGVAGEMPGMTGYAVFDLTAGDYVLYCFISDAKDGKTHGSHGMFKQFTVK